jgi:hypothetical protein
LIDVEFKELAVVILSVTFIKPLDLISPLSLIVNLLVPLILFMFIPLLIVRMFDIETGSGVVSPVVLLLATVKFFPKYIVAPLEIPVEFAEIVESSGGDILI